jgi:hypothetical protein
MRHAYPGTRLPRRLLLMMAFLALAGPSCQSRKAAAPATVSTARNPMQARRSLLRKAPDVPAAGVPLAGPRDGKTAGNR